jgi:glycosyltransferase involved in cell wall biosynthesis
VATAVPGCRDVVEHEVNGLLVPARNVDALTAALRHLLINAPLRQEMGTRGRELAERRFDVRDIVSRTLKIYERALGAGTVV